MNKIVLQVPKMACRHCVRVVTAHLRDLDGVQIVEADALTATLVVRGHVTEAQLRAALAEIEFPTHDTGPRGP
jgi:copper chaperone CopZ